MNTAPSQPNAKKSNVALIIILVVVGFLVVVGVGGYFGWKYFKSKVTTAASTTGTKTTTSDKVSLKALETLFNYPTGTITKTEHPTGSSLASIINAETQDKIQTIYDYYGNLATTKNLTVTKKAMASDKSNADYSFEGAGYTADIAIYQWDANAEVDISIYGENITNDTAGATSNTTSSTSTTTTAATTTSSTAKTGTIPVNSYVIADSNTRVIAASELSALTPWQLKVARNEIYARYGRTFIHQDLTCYFKTQSWYKTNASFTESLLSSIDTKNVATIQAYEQKTNSPLQNTDSGC